jgi:UDP-3-O-[3-hydroxymyristoyl] glucosamine N-acyltransferase
VIGLADDRPTTARGGEAHSLSAASLASLINGELLGDATAVVTGVAALDRATPSHLSVLSHARYAAWYRDTSAGVVLVSAALKDTPGSPRARIVVSDPMQALLALLPHFHRVPVRVPGVHPSAVIADDVVLGDGVSVDANAVVESGVRLGARVWIGAQTVVGAGTVISDGAQLHPNVTVYPWTEIGARTVLHSGARVGREGFGWVPVAGGVQRMPHVGRCVIGSDVEIGANSTVDRGSIDDTVIGDGTKIDNLVQVAHNVRIGRGCMIASQVGIAGSARIGDGVQVGGQAGIGGHLTVGDRATIGGQGGVVGDVPAGEVWSGYPARPHREQMRAYAALQRLSAVIRPIEQWLAERAARQTASETSEAS